MNRSDRTEIPSVRSVSLATPRKLRASKTQKSSLKQNQEKLTIKRSEIQTANGFISKSATTKLCFQEDANKIIAKSAQSTLLANTISSIGVCNMLSDVPYFRLLERARDFLAELLAAFLLCVLRWLLRSCALLNFISQMLHRYSTGYIFTHVLCNLRASASLFITSAQITQEFVAIFLLLIVSRLLSHKQILDSFF